MPLPVAASARLLLKAHLTSADIWIHVKATLSVDGNARPRLSKCSVVQVGIRDTFVFIQLRLNRSIWIDHHRVSPGIVVRFHVSRRAAQADVYLVVHSSRARLQLPMHGARCEVECAWVHQQKGILSRADHGQLRKPDIIAYSHSDLAILWQVDESDLVAWRQHLALVERDLARYVDVKEMHFAMRADQIAIGIEGQGGIVVLLRLLPVLGDAAADQICLGLFCELGQGVEGGCLLFGRRRWQERFGVFREVLRSIGTVEALGKHDEVGALGRGLEHFGASAREVGRLVCSGRQLHQRQLQRLLEEFRHGAQPVCDDGRAAVCCQESVSSKRECWLRYGRNECDCRRVFGRLADQHSNPVVGSFAMVCLAWLLMNLLRLHVLREQHP